MDKAGANEASKERGRLTEGLKSSYMGSLRSSVTMTGGVVSVSIVMYLLYEEEHFFPPLSIAAVEG